MTRPSGPNIEFEALVDVVFSLVVLQLVLRLQDLDCSSVAINPTGPDGFSFEALIHAILSLDPNRNLFCACLHVYGI